jgi:hypothetical protein
MWIEICWCITCYKRQRVTEEHLYVSTGSCSVAKNCLSVFARMCGLVPGGGSITPQPAHACNKCEC